MVRHDFCAASGEALCDRGRKGVHINLCISEYEFTLLFGGKAGGDGTGEEGTGGEAIGDALRYPPTQTTCAVFRCIQTYITPHRFFCPSLLCRVRRTDRQIRYNFVHPDKPNKDAAVSVVFLMTRSHLTVLMASTFPTRANTLYPLFHPRPLATNVM